MGLDYTETTIGKLDLGNIGNRIKELASVMAAEGYDDVASRLGEAYGAIKAYQIAPKTAPETACAPEMPKCCHGFGSH